MRSYAIQYDEGFWLDIKNIINWYDAVSPDTCNRFLEQFWFAESKIISNPYAFSKIAQSGFRRILLKKFPYKMYFRIEEKTIFIVAIIHTARSKRYVKKRLK